MTREPSHTFSTLENNPQLLEAVPHPPSAGLSKALLFSFSGALNVQDFEEPKAKAKQQSRLQVCKICNLDCLGVNPHFGRQSFDRMPANQHHQVACKTQSRISRAKHHSVSIFATASSSCMQHTAQRTLRFGVELVDDDFFHGEDMAQNCLCALWDADAGTNTYPARLPPHTILWKTEHTFFLCKQQKKIIATRGAEAPSRWRDLCWEHLC